LARQKFIMVKQRTLRKAFSISGIGLHTGKKVDLTLWPAPDNTGVIFRRIDLDPIVSIPATTQHVSDTRLNTCLSNGEISIATVEHLLSALGGLSIDNVFIDLNSTEPPALDGSALPFVELIESVGIIEQETSKKFIRIKREITVREDDKFIILQPYDGFRISMTIDFKHPFVAKTKQSFSIELSPSSYVNEISYARTFGFLAEYEYLRKNNLGLGASLENTLVLDEKGILNDGGLRDDAEFVKHKIVDAVGDLSLLGCPIIGGFIGYKSGHALNHSLRQALLMDRDAWDWVT
jgi:UDP-3-O-[3-hydroxymyristoyl] N-acetylglucosamine deacetylase